MSNTDPFNDITPGGMAGNPGRTPERGTAEVHTRVTGGQGTGSRDNLGFERGATGGEQNLADRARNRAQDAWEGVQDQAEELTEQASDLASRARGEVTGLLDRAETQLEERTGIVSMVRQNPVAAAGIAFGIGFLLAGSGSKRRRSGIVGRASGQLRSAVIGSVSTMLMQELQDMLDEHGGPAGLLSSLTSRGGGSGPEREFGNDRAFR